MKIVVTGASGYIGKRLVSCALAHNHQLVVASRYPYQTVLEWLPYEISDSAGFILPDQVDVVIHLAANTSTEVGSEEQELVAANNLLLSSGIVGAKFIFISSQTAREDAPTNYGRTKWLIEREVLAANGIVIRLGQVYGGPEQGLFGTLVSIVRRYSVLPAFIPSPIVQPIHVDDCAEGILRLIEQKDRQSRVYCFAASTPIPFTEFLRSIAKNRVRHRKIFIPIPTFLVFVFIRVIGGTLSEKHYLNRLKSLFDIPVMSTAPDLGIVNLKLRRLSSGMDRSGNDRRRRLIKEGIAVLSYLLKEKPHPVLIRRYVHMVDKLRAGTPLDLPNWLSRFPAGLFLLDRHATKQSEFLKEIAWRLDAATVIAEASRQGAIRFIGSTQIRSRATALLCIVIACISELVWRMIGLVTPSSFLGLSKRRGE